MQAVGRAVEADIGGDGPACSAASSASMSVHWRMKPRAAASARKSLAGLAGLTLDAEEAGLIAQSAGGGNMLRTIGLMSGTSLDGVDAAWLETDGETDRRVRPDADVALR